jgi:hypothetical protein
VSVQVMGNDASFCGEHRKDGPEHLDLAQASVQQEERFSLSVELVVVIQAVGRDVAARKIRISHSFISSNPPPTS